MDRSTFWKLIELVDHDALRESDDAAAVAPLIAKLSSCSESQIRDFEEHLTQVLYALDGRSFADHAGESGGSDDAFLYARCFVVAQGENHCQLVLADPTAMPQSIDEWCEALLSVAQEAWTASTGRAAEEWDCACSVSYETGSNAAQWP